MKRTKDMSLKCFSPPVMLATFMIEVVAALWILWRYRRTTTSKLIVIILSLLATFQVAEYMICEGTFWLSSLDWARVGFAAISFLPALGMHLAMHLRGKVSGVGMVAGYVVATAFAGFFLTVGQGVTSSVCGGNYVLVGFMEHMNYPYIVFYYGWTIVSMSYASYWSGRLKSKSTAKALRWLAYGYAVFLVPTTLVNIINPTTLAAIPSIMCGFAVFLALILLFWVAPYACEAQPARAVRLLGRGRAS